MLVFMVSFLPALVVSFSKQNNVTCSAVFQRIFIRMTTACTGEKDASENFPIYQKKEKEKEERAGDRTRKIRREYER